MSRIVSVVGTRPNFIKIDPDLEQEIWVTGQHYDPEMNNTTFFKELGLHSPKHNFVCTKLGDMISAIQTQIMADQPTLVIVYGDSNSSLAGAIAAKQERVHLAHVEAGLRSGDRYMIEEQNRKMIDNIADFLFCPTNNSLYNLEKEGLTRGFLVGDPMYDQIKRHFPKPVEPENFTLLTLHRQENVDSKMSLITVLDALEASKLELWWPIHPRTAKRIKDFKIIVPTNIKVLPPQSYLAMLQLIAKSKKVITDSGGVQKEAYFLKKPTLTLRDQTEWPETIQDGWNVLLHIYDPYLKDKLAEWMPVGKSTDAFGDGHAWDKMRKVLKDHAFV